MDHFTLVQQLAQDYSPHRLNNLMRHLAPAFRPQEIRLQGYLHPESPFHSAEGLGVIEFSNATTYLVASIGVSQQLTERRGKRQQYELAKRILKAHSHNGGLFAFYDPQGRFRLSLITVSYSGTHRQFSTFRRYTFFVDPSLPNKTFLQQFRRAEFSTPANLLETFSLEAVSNEFYKEFKPQFDALAAGVQETLDDKLRQDFALLFVIRTLFLGFVQKKGWLGNNPCFLQDFWAEYQRIGVTDRFYREWLEPLFFEALSSPPGRKVAYGKAPFSEETERTLQMAPYLNGELFKRKHAVDDQGLWIPDHLIGAFFDFLFQYNFTVEENELYDEELELNPEFLGIIFERLTNMDQGAVYTPRIEVDLMCRLALVTWLEQTTPYRREDLYHLFFHEAGSGEEGDEHQKLGDFSPEQIADIITRLENVTVCDPAAGSGAFEVGMLQVLEQVLTYLYTHPQAPEMCKANPPSPFERKKAIIANSLYGVEVKRWAVWINHLRLWLTLFVDMPAEFCLSYEPLLPNLTFKVRTGDSLVQRIGGQTFPLQSHPNLSADLKAKITTLKQHKRDFFYNRLTDYQPIENEELAVFKEILDKQIRDRQSEIRKQTEILNRYDRLTFDATFNQLSEKEQREAQAIQERIAILQNEIQALQEQKRNLKEEHPFLWSIEFPEVFFGERGGFDIVIGNPPYVRQESIRDPLGKLTPAEYKRALQEMVRLDFPEYFAKSAAELDQFKRDRQPDGRSDLYTYFYIRSLRLLNPKGVHVFICSNSWLDVGYGAWLQEFFLRKAPLHLVIDNHARRSFARADINTIITVAASPRAKGEVDPQHLVRFIAFKKPFEEEVLSDHLLPLVNATQTFTTEVARVVPLSVAELWREGQEIGAEQSGKYLGDKWGGKYLRAPQIFFTILEKGKGKLVRLGEIAEVRRGFTTGANDFFYLQPLGPGSRPGLLRVRNGAGWEGEIEEEFLKPVIKSPRECQTILIHPEDLRYRIFMCHKSKEELKGTKALEYIEWGESQGYSLRTTLDVRKRWWDLGNREPGLYLWPMIHNDRLAVFLNIYRVQVDHNLFEIIPNSQNVVIFSLFSIISVMFRELLGRSNLGEGAVKTEGIDIKRFPSIILPAEEKVFDKLSFVSTLSVFTECGIDPHSPIPIAEQEPHPLPDRQALDNLVFDALGLTEDERKEVYRAVCQLVWERIQRAQNVGRD